MSLLFEEFKTICFHLNRVGITSIDSLPDFAGVSESDIELIHLENITFRVPSLEQYLSIYKVSSQDSYRNNQNSNKDFKKIEWLERHL